METVIDWSKAPEGTEAAHPGSTNILQAWFKRDANGLVHQICPGAGVNSWSWMGGRRDFPYGYVLRPSTDKQTWDGEGLPPVGTVCELRANKLNEWGRALIKFASRNVVVWDWEGEPEISGLCTRYAHEVEMRSIRTPEQIAAEEREKAIDEMAQDLGKFFSNPKMSARTIYDAGYRKQVTP